MKNHQSIPSVVPIFEVEPALLPARLKMFFLIAMFQNYTVEYYTDFQKLLIDLCSIARVTRLLIVPYAKIAKIDPV